MAKGKAVELTVETSDGKAQATRFTIWRREDLEKRERYALYDEGAELILEEDWADEGFAVYEKRAALEAGIGRGEGFLVTFEVIDGGVR